MNTSLKTDGHLIHLYAWRQRHTLGLFDSSTSPGLWFNQIRASYRDLRAHQHKSIYRDKLWWQPKTAGEKMREMPLHPLRSHLSRYQAPASVQHNAEVIFDWVSLWNTPKKPSWKVQDLPNASEDKSQGSWDNWQDRISFLSDFAQSLLFFFFLWIPQKHFQAYFPNRNVPAQGVLTGCN